MIRRATTADLPVLQQIFASARAYMKATGNPDQWTPDYPSDALLLSEIAANHCFVMVNEEGRVNATFCFIEGDDPTYAEIDGAWLNREPYATIHRIASDGTSSGILHQAMEWGSRQTDNIRIDTHKKNRPMLEAIRREGFSYCGVIICHNGTPREAFQKKMK